MLSRCFRRQRMYARCFAAPFGIPCTLTAIHGGISVSLVIASALLRVFVFISWHFNALQYTQLITTMYEIPNTFEHWRTRVGCCTCDEPQNHLPTSCCSMYPCTLIALIFFFTRSGTKMDTRCFLHLKTKALHEDDRMITFLEMVFSELAHRTLLICWNHLFRTYRLSNKWETVSHEAK